MLNMDFSAPIAIDTSGLEWLPSPMPGVQRKPLAREDAERGHATSIVKYEPGSMFRAHPHPLGEEILVLDGVFCDESGAYPAGTYFRNPPGSSHAPFSPEGCVLFVKLHQFQAHDTAHVVVSSNNISNLKEGELSSLHVFEQEHVDLLKVSADRDLQAFDRLDLTNGVEILVVSGQIDYQGESYSKLSWLRLPRLSWQDIHIIEPTIFWLKSGHLVY